MAKLRFLVLILLFGAAACSTLTDTDQPLPPKVDGFPAAVDDLVYARQFRLAQGYKYTWSKDAPVIDSGFIVVLGVNPEFVVPHDTSQPVLYAGEGTVQRAESWT